MKNAVAPVWLIHFQHMWFVTKHHLFPLSHTFSLRPLAQFLLYMTNLIFLPTCSTLNTPLNVYQGCICMFVNLYGVHVYLCVSVSLCVCVCVWVRLFCGRMWSALIEVNQRNPRVQRSNSIAFIDQATFSASVPLLCSLLVSLSLSFLQLSVPLLVYIYLTKCFYKLFSVLSNICVVDERIN